ncbi:MAG: DUF3500 domain-containing protein [Mycobacterium sp.]
MTAGGSADYRGYQPRRGRFPLRRGTVDFADEAGMSKLIELVGAAELPPVEANALEPFVGVTDHGQPVNHLETSSGGFDSAPAATAAAIYLRSLMGTQRAAACLPFDAPEWRMWSNAFLTFPEHGLLLQELTNKQRQAALEVIKATLSVQGFSQLRRAMKLNAELGDYVPGYDDTLTEWCYWFTIFGNPERSEPWGWQLAGHHIDLHAVMLNGHLILTPAFLGCEFRAETLFDKHRRSALTFMSSLGPREQGKAQLYGSMLADELPPALAGVVDGRHRAGAGRDNLVLPYEGLRGDSLSRGQRELLAGLVDVYLDGLPSGGVRETRRQDIEKHLDATYIAWIGQWDQDSPFYYRVHSPVILIEYDNHPGIFLDNDNPEPFHVHTIVRTPNGGDYGKNLLRAHYDQYHQQTNPGA